MTTVKMTMPVVKLTLKFPPLFRLRLAMVRSLILLACLVAGDIVEVEVDEA